MSAIAGIWNLDHTPVEAATLQQMASALGHRGAITGLWHHDAIGMLALFQPTTPEAAYERLPLVAPNQAFVLCADARLDNRAELLPYFDFRGQNPNEIPDSRFLLAAYERWGERCVEHLLGDFSFVIWDAQEQRLFCARDHMGIRPFYYYHAQGLFCFSTEIRALLTLPQIPRQIDELKIVDHLLMEYHDKTSTFYRAIHRLPPAHSLVVSNHGLHLTQYWQPDPELTLNLKSDEDYAEQFRDIFASAVRCRLRAVKPIGSLLSGGLDSSSVTLVAQRQLAETQTQPFFTVSALFPSLPDVDEKRYIDQVTARGRFSSHYEVADVLNPFADMDEILRHIEQPHLIPNLLMTWHLFGIARAEGVGVILDGTDGDTAVSHGLGILMEMAYSGRWKQFAALGKALHQKYPASGDVPANMLATYGLPTIAQLARDGRWVAALLAVREVRANFQMPYRKLLSKHLLTPLVQKPQRLRRTFRHAENRLAPEFLQRIDLRHWHDLLQLNRISPERTERHIHINRLMPASTTELLEVLDKMSAAFGMEMRHPLYDKRLIEFCVALPTDQKINDEGWTRLVLRRAMQDILPPEIQWRPGKANLAPNYMSAFVKYGGEQIEEALRIDPAPLDRYVNLPALQASYQRFKKRQTEPDAMQIWAAVILRRWLRLHADD